MDALQFAPVFLTSGVRVMRQTRRGYAPVCRELLSGCRGMCRGCESFRPPEGGDMVLLARMHLARRVTLAASPLLEGQARWGCIDVDRGRLTRAEQRRLTLALLGEVRHFFPEALLEFSGRKGYHIWLLLDAPVPAPAMRGFLLRTVEKVGQKLPVDSVEVFPRQVCGAGSVVKLPLSVHRGSGRFCPFLDDAFRPRAVRSLPLTSAELFLEVAREEGWEATVVPEGRDKKRQLPLICADPRILYVHCAAVRGVWARQVRDARQVSYEEWFRWIVLPLARFEGGEELIHRLSALYPRYDERVTQRTIDYVRARGYAPPACLAPGQSRCPAGRRPQECGLAGRNPSPLRFALPGGVRAA